MIAWASYLFWLLRNVFLVTNLYKAQDSVQQTVYKIVDDAVVSARTVQPGSTVSTTISDNSQPPKTGTGTSRPGNSD